MNSRAVWARPASHRPRVLQRGRPYLSRDVPAERLYQFCLPRDGKWEGWDAGCRLSGARDSCGRSQSIGRPGEGAGNVVSKHYIQLPVEQASPE
jgi:hypothetical protein